MRTLSFFLCLPLLAAIGDNAPPIPPTYVTTHPRLGFPSSTYLTGLWNGANIPTRFTTDTSVGANQFSNPMCSGSSANDPCNKSNPYTYAWNLALVYAAAKQGGADFTQAPFSSWKTALQQLLDFGPIWRIGTAYINDTHASASGCNVGGLTQCTITDTSVDFTLGCSGTCASKTMLYGGVWYTIGTVTATTAIITKNNNYSPYNFPDGSNLRIIVTTGYSGGLSLGQSAMAYALLYDWIWANPAYSSDFTAAQISYAQTMMLNAHQLLRNDYTTNSYSVYNDQGYCVGSSSWSGCVAYLAIPLAIYPDTPVGAGALPALRWALDLFLNMRIPVWDQIAHDGGWHESWNDYLAGNAPQISLHGAFTAEPLLWAYASGYGVGCTFGLSGATLPGGGSCPTNTGWPWIKNWAYLTAYLTKPDGVPYKLGASSTPNLNRETLLSGAPAATAIMCSLNTIAEIYNDPDIRGWARFVNGTSTTFLDGHSPSAWPFYAPDKLANTATGYTSGTATLTGDPRVNMPLCRKFGSGIPHQSGIGMTVCRTGWGEDDVWFIAKYSDNFWSHQHQDAGQFSIFKMGNLAIDGGTYHAGSYADENLFYTVTSAAHNVMLVHDPADSYSNQLIQDGHSSGPCIPFVNDGGQRRVGSGWQTYFQTSVCGQGLTNTVINSPDNLAMWMRAREYYHYTDLMAFAASPNTTNPAYVYLAVDLTPAYNNSISGNSKFTNDNSGNYGGYGASNRTNRVRSYIREFLWVPRGSGTASAAYVMVFDHISTTDASFVKTWTLHSINAPVITTNTPPTLSKFVIQRTENICSKSSGNTTWPNNLYSPLLTHITNNCPEHVSTNDGYQYNGQLIGYMVYPLSASAGLCALGGAGHEFDDASGITSLASSANCTLGVNHSGCDAAAGIICASPDPSAGASDRCQTEGDCWGLGNTSNGCPAGTICPTSATGPLEPGAYRLQETQDSSRIGDYFLNVLFASSASEANLPLTVTQQDTATTAGVQITDKPDGVNTCTYTATFNKAGIGAPSFTEVGVGCVHPVN